MTNVTVPSSRGRSDYMRVLQTVGEIVGIPAEDVPRTYKVYDDILKLPQRLVANQSAYTFNLLRSADAAVPGENKIDMNDLFAITGVGLRFTRAAYASTTGIVSDWGNYPEFTYPYAQYFSGTNEATALQTIVRGSLALNVVNDQQWKVPCSDLVYEDVQYTGGTFTPSFGGDNGRRGIFELNSIVIVGGFNDNTLTLSLLQGVTTAIEGPVQDAKNFVMPVLYGIHIKNVSSGGFDPKLCAVR